MKINIKRTFRISALLIFVSMVCPSCFKNPPYPENSIVGPWRSYEQSALTAYRQYNVNIERDRIDTSRYVIFNFYNKGFDLETYTQRQGAVLTIIGTNNFGISFSGIGRIQPQHKGILWEYSFVGSGQQPDYNIEAAYYRP